MKESEAEKKGTGTPQVVEVIPILKGLPKAALTYFHRGEIALGEFVNIEVRGTPTIGLITRVRDAREARSDLRSSAYALKKLTGTASNLGITQALVRAAEMTAAYYATTTGAVLGNIIPKFLLTETDALTFNFPEPERSSAEPLLLQVEAPERFAVYKSIVRERFARRESVIFIAPTAELAHRAFHILSQGIEDYVYLLSFSQTKKQIKETLQDARTQPHPILLVTTPAGIVFNRTDLSTIILEHENSRNLRTHTKPYLSYKTLFEFYAKASGKTLILGDTVLSVESLFKEKTATYVEFQPLKWRLTPPCVTSIVDMKSEKPSRDTFEIFSPKLRKLVHTALESEEQVFLFGARKGLAPSTVCGDCGTLLPCKNCGAPVILHKKTADERIYVCHACGATRPAETRCDNCSSWKLVPLGIGIDRIADEARTLWPEVPVLIFDKDHVKTAAGARSLEKKLRTMGKAIIVGSELFTTYHESVPFSAIVSMDSLFSIPDFSMHERVFSLVTAIQEMTTKEVLIQTRNIGKEILTHAAKGDILGFYRGELSDRETFMYPPYSIFIRASRDTKNDELSKEAFRLNNLFGAWNPDFMRIRSKKAGFSTAVMVLRLKRHEWPDPDLRDKLSLIAQDFLIKVDPETIP